MKDVMKKKTGIAKRTIPIIPEMVCFKYKSTSNMDKNILNPLSTSPIFVFIMERINGFTSLKLFF